MLQKQGKKWRKKAKIERMEAIFFLQNTSMCTYQSGIQCKPSMLQSYSTVPFDLVRCWRNFIFFFSLAMNCLLVNSKNLGPIKGTWLALTLPFFSPTCTRSNWYGWYQLINGVGLLTLLDWQLNLICIYLLWKTTHKFSLEKLANAFFFSFSPLTFDIFYWNRKVSLSKC